MSRPDRPATVDVGRNEGPGHTVDEEKETPSGKAKATGAEIDETTPRRVSFVSSGELIPTVFIPPSQFDDIDTLSVCSENPSNSV